MTTARTASQKKARVGARIMISCNNSKIEQLFAKNNMTQWSYTASQKERQSNIESSKELEGIVYLDKIQ